MNIFLMQKMYLIDLEYLFVGNTLIFSLVYCEVYSFSFMDFLHFFQHECGSFCKALVMSRGACRFVLFIKDSPEVKKSEMKGMP